MLKFNISQKQYFLFLGWKHYWLWLFTKSNSASLVMAIRWALAIVPNFVYSYKGATSYIAKEHVKKVSWSFPGKINSVSSWSLKRLCSVFHILTCFWINSSKFHYYYMQMISSLNHISMVISQLACVLNISIPAASKALLLISHSS